MKVHVLHAHNNKKKDLLSKHFPTFPTEYTKRIFNYRRWQDIQASIIGRLLLSQGLNNFYDINLDFNTIQNDRYKRPFLINSQIDFNISHTEEMVVCAITKTCRIGIDIEKVKEISIKDFLYQMTNFEYEKIMTSDNKREEFFKYWTQKEAVLKAQGEGLVVPLKTFEIKKKKTYLFNQKYYVFPINLGSQYICHLASTNKIFANEIQLNEVKI